MNIAIQVGIFITTVLLIEGVYFAYRRIRNPERRKVRQRLAGLSWAAGKPEEISIARKRMLSELPWLNRILLRWRWLAGGERLLKQANIVYPLGVFILLTGLLAVSGFLLGSWFWGGFPIPFLSAIFFGAFPFIYVYSKKRWRMKKFHRQLPDSLELIARSLRAGHAFSTGMKMVAEEFEDPVGTEFNRTLDEINFGVGVNDALKNLSERVDCPDLKYFVISVILQRETGGNLAELLENIAGLIRERFKLQGHIRTLAAEGKLSAIILIALPFFVGFVLSLLNPGYIATLFTDPLGSMMAAFAGILMGMGVLVIRKTIQIEV